MKVTYFQNSNGGCDWYRAVLPLESAAKQKLIQIEKLWPQNIICDIQYNPVKFEKSMKSDVFFLQRVIGYSFMTKISEAIRSNPHQTRITMDHDDNVFSVSPLSNHYVDYGTREAKIESNGKIAFEWKDGVNIDIKENIKRLDEIKRGLELCDMVTVTTEPLADVYRQYNENVRILPNCVDLNGWPKMKFQRENPEEVRIVWSGGHSHWEDLYLVRNPLREIVNKHKNVKLVVCGYLPQGMADDYPKAQFEHHDWVETAAHSYRMALLDADISVVPLKDNEFNRCKSAIKWVEMAALKVPSVASLVTPYKEMIALSEKDNGIYIEDNDESSWIKGLEVLVADSDLRKSIGNSAYEVVKNCFDVNTQCHQWVNAFNEVLTCQSQVTRH